jgi:hypothetical protein
MFRVRIAMFWESLKVAVFAPIRILNRLWLWCSGCRYTAEADRSVRDAISRYVHQVFLCAVEARLVCPNTGLVQNDDAVAFRAIWLEVRGSVSQTDAELFAVANVFRGPDYIDDLVARSWNAELSSALPP